MIPAKKFLINELEKYISWSDIEKSHNYQPDDLSQVFWWHVLLLSINKAKLALFGISLALQLLPLAGFLLELVLRHDRCRSRYARRSHGRGRALTSLLLEVHRSLGCLGMGNHLRCLLGLCLHLSRESSASLPEKSLDST